MLKPESTKQFSIRPPKSVADELESIAKSYGITRAELAVNVLKVALSDWSNFEEFSETTTK